MSWKPKQCVVVPIDFSESSPNAIQTGLDCAESPEFVHVVHVLPSIEYASPGVMWGMVDEESRVAKTKSYFDSFLRENKIRGVKTAVLPGDPGRRVVDYATECHAELIVIPSHGYHGFKHMLLGSTAERVIRYADCPVLVLRRSDAE